MNYVYSVKMRASKRCGDSSIHISGAERIVEYKDLNKSVNILTERALKHSKGSADDINIKIEKIDKNDIHIVDVLKTNTVEVDSKEEGILYLKRFLSERNIKNPDYIIDMILNSENMSGAILLDINSLKRLEKDQSRGIRVTYMDYKEKSDIDLMSEKNHYREALALATKVVSCPQVWGEICISDDPDYITGYIATENDGYTRITKLKEKGSAKGARIILYKGNESEVDECIDYLTKAKVWINEENI